MDVEDKGIPLAALKGRALDDENDIQVEGVDTWVDQDKAFLYDLVVLAEDPGAGVHEDGNASSVLYSQRKERVS